MRSPGRPHHGIRERVVNLGQKIKENVPNPIKSAAKRLKRLVTQPANEARLRRQRPESASTQLNAHMPAKETPVASAPEKKQFVQEAPPPAEPEPDKTPMTPPPPPLEEAPPSDRNKKTEPENRKSLGFNALFIPTPEELDQEQKKLEKAIEEISSRVATNLDQLANMSPLTSQKERIHFNKQQEALKNEALPLLKQMMELAGNRFLTAEDSTFEIIQTQFTKDERTKIMDAITQFDKADTLTLDQLKRFATNAFAYHPNPEKAMEYLAQTALAPSSSVIIHNKSLLNAYVKNGYLDADQLQTLYLLRLKNYAQRENLDPIETMHRALSLAALATIDKDELNQRIQEVKKQRDDARKQAQEK